MRWILDALKRAFSSSEPVESDSDSSPKKNQPEEVVGPEEVVAPEHQDQVLKVETVRPETSYEALIRIASSFVGTVEVGGNNRGPVIEMFQKSVGPVAWFQPWCASFVWHCIKAVEMGAVGPICPLKLTAHVMTIWNTAPAKTKKKYGAPGYLMVWRKFGPDGKALPEGHIGIVEQRVGGTVYQCIEGNTGPTEGIQREGDGVYRKVRNSGAAGAMRCVGFLDPWAV